jgi:aspartyl aminopeptidase
MTNENSKGLIDFINQAPTPYTTVSALKKMLDEAGGREIKLSEMNGDFHEGGLYYVTFNDLCLGAFIKGSNFNEGIRFVATHTDHPVLKLKPKPSRTGGGVERLSAEVYGSTINHTWVDRPLKLCGRVSFLTKDGNISFADIDSGRHTVVIPGAAIHVVRDVNDNAKFSIQNELLPFFALSPDNGESSFTEWLSEVTSEASGQKVSKEEILNFDISLYDAAPACFTGIKDEFISSPALDDLALTYTAFRSLCDVSKKSEITKGNIPYRAVLAFNHEECGSLSNTGARSVFTKAFFLALCGVSEVELTEIMGRTTAYSCDMAHATHPAYESKSDSQHRISHGDGIVLKTSQNQAYSTSVAGCSEFISLCKRAEVPYTIFAGHSDTRCGSTIGPMLSADLGVNVVDIGVPMLSMHSVREFCAVSDIEAAVKFFTALFS